MLPHLAHRHFIAVASSSFKLLLGSQPITFGCTSTVAVSAMYKHMIRSCHHQSLSTWWTLDQVLIFHWLWSAPICDTWCVVNVLSTKAPGTCSLMYDVIICPPMPRKGNFYFLASTQSNTGQPTGIFMCVFFVSESPRYSS